MGEGERERGLSRGPMGRSQREREREREVPSPGDPWGKAGEREREREREAPPPGDLWGGAGGREVPSGPGVLLLVPTHSLDEGLQVRTEMMGPRVS